MHASSLPVLGFVLALSLPSAAQAAPAKVTVAPREIDAVFANPGMGWQTFHRFADEDPNLAGLPSASAYFRFYWREIEPREGEIDFTRLNDLLAHAHRAGQKLAFRVMCTGSGQEMDVPRWLKDQGCKGIEFTYGGRRHWVPDFADALFQRAHDRLIQELGRRYDGHPDMDLLDIGSVGLWGEWHMSGTEAVDTGKPVPLPPLEVQNAIIDAWRSAFSKSLKVIQIGSEQGMARADTAGYGWRADCLGDMGGFSKTWNHMENFYLQQVERTHAQEVWKHAAVAFESCWDMRKWKQENWDIPYIFDYALRCHASYMNNKSAPIPEGTRAEVERFLRKLGYRLVLRRIEHAPGARAGSELKVSTEWENVGVAPPYRANEISLRLRNRDNGREAFASRHPSIQGWLPGNHAVELVCSLPSDLPPGRYQLAIAVVEPVTQKPEVRLAIEARDSEGWSPISEVDVTD